MSILRSWIYVAVLAVPYINTTPIANDLLENNEIEGNSFTKESLSTKCALDGGFNSLITCAATRALKLIEYASRTESLTIFPGISLTSEKPLPQREGKAITTSDLPSSLSERVDVLIQLVVDATSRFFSGRSIKIDIPEITPINSVEEGRAKSKKSGGSPLMLILGAKVLLIKSLLIAVLKFMSIKALILAKIALVISVVLAAQTLFGRGNGITPYFGGGSHGIGSGWNSGTGPAYGAPGWTTNSIGGWTNSQYPYARSINDDEIDAQTEAQDLAYSKQKP